MKKLLVICGPTATGKTALAIRLAKKFNCELISADSRQVYCWMNIGTGKELPVNSKFKIQSSKLGRQGIGFYEVDGVKIWGYDLVEPTQEFSVAQYVKIARKIINVIWQPRQKLSHSGGQGEKLPILVGGTGLYIKAVVNGIPSAKIPKKVKLRKSLKDKSADELFEILAQLDPIRAASMNVSDKKNPRRLIRAIEVSITKVKGKGLKVKGLEADVLFIGLTASKKYLDEKIEERVDMRVLQGIEKEIESLFLKGVTWRHQSMQALGYKKWRDFFEYKKSQKVVILNWKQAEKQYVKRQMTWFKRDKRIHWFDISEMRWEKDVERLVKKWYISSNKER